MLVPEQPQYSFESSRLPLSPNRQVVVERIEALFWGIAIGDALGLPFETKTKSEIDQDFASELVFKPTTTNPFVSNLPAGTWSDDTQLSLAAAEGLVDGNGFNLAAQIAAHVRALDQSTLGWGGSTEDAIRKLKNGASPEKAGIPVKEGRGLGNGVCMKLAPVAAYFYWEGRNIEDCIDDIAAYTALTHKTDEALACSLALTAVFFECFRNDIASFSVQCCIDAAIHASTLGEGKFLSYAEDVCIPSILNTLRDVNRVSSEEIIDRYGGGQCTVFHSLPFSLAFFFKNYHSFTSVYEVINAGGDTDSNAAIVGALLGALCGDQTLPWEYIDGLQDVEKIKRGIGGFKSFLSH